MIKVLFSKGVFVPIEGLPLDLAPESELVIEIKEVVREPTAEEVEAWWRQLDAAAAQMTLEDSARLQAALDDIRRQGKEQARAAMGLP
jgi:hypothetical protein